MSSFPNSYAVFGLTLLGISLGIGILPAQAQVNCQALLNEIFRLGPGAANQARAFAIQNQYNANCTGSGMAVPAQQFGTGPGPAATGIIGAIIDAITPSPDIQGMITDRSLYPGIPQIDLPTVIPDSYPPQGQEGVPMREVPVIDANTGATIGVMRAPAVPVLPQGPVGQIEAPPPGFYDGGNKPDFYQERD